MFVVNYIYYLINKGLCVCVWFPIKPMEIHIVCSLLTLYSSNIPFVWVSSTVYVSSGYVDFHVVYPFSDTADGFTITQKNSRHAHFTFQSTF